MSYINISQHEVCICPLPFELPSHPPPYPTYCHSALASGSLCDTSNSHWLSVLHLVMYVFQCSSLISFHFLLPLLCPKCLCLLCCLESRSISTIFLDSIYVWSYMIFVFLFRLTLLYIIGSRFIHLIRTDSNAFIFIAK